MVVYTQAAILGVSLTFPPLGLLLVGVRFWQRKHFQRLKLGLDDWTILFAAVLVVGMGANFIVGSYLGTMGMDGKPTVPSREATQPKIDYAMLVMEKPVYGAIKLSVLFFYRRIFTLPTPRLINNCLIALIVCWTLAFWLTDILNCGAHPDANWDPTVKAHTTCINLYEFLLVFAITDVLTDVAILWIPYPQLKKLNMSLKERWALAGVFALGTLDLLIGLVRFSFVIVNQTIPAVNSNFNPPESTAPTFWTVVEVAIGVIAANLPALAPMFRHRAQLTSMVSSLRDKLLTRSDRSASVSGFRSTRNDSAVSGDGRGARKASAAQKNAGGALLDGEVLHVDEAKGVVQGNRNESVGTWDQFAKIADSDSAEEEEKRYEERYQDF